MNSEELLKTYKDLYLSYGNSDRCIDYEVLIRMYVIYLSMFFHKEGSFYHDVEFLIYVVRGFKYYCDLIYGDLSPSDSVMFGDIIKHEIVVRKKIVVENKNKSARVNYSDSDLALLYSLDAYSLLEGMNLIENFCDDVKLLAYNSYIIEEKTGEARKECEENGMEYRKGKN